MDLMGTRLSSGGSELKTLKYTLKTLKYTYTQYVYERRFM